MYLGLQRGWAVSVSDHLGPTGAYGEAKLGGMITLDSVRAVQRVAELGLANSPVALAGYSGGGMASAWAAALAPTYAPELKLAVVVQGGVPADLEQMAEGLGFNPHPGFGLAFAAAIGLEREYPDRLPVSSQLNETSLWLREWMSNECRRFLLFHGAFRNAGQLAASTSLMASSAALQVLRENSLRYFEGVPTGADVHVARHARRAHSVRFGGGGGAPVLRGRGEADVRALRHLRAHDHRGGGLSGCVRVHRGTVPGRARPDTVPGRARPDTVLTADPANRKGAGRPGPRPSACTVSSAGSVKRSVHGLL